VQLSTTWNRAVFAAGIDIGYVMTASVGLPHRFKLYEVLMAVDDASGDDLLLWRVRRRTTLGDGGANPLVHLDGSDIATTSLQSFGTLGTPVTVNGTNGGIVLEVPLNQRATWRWVAAPGGEFVSSNATDNGFGVSSTKKPAAGNVIQSVCAKVEEI